MYEMLLRILPSVACAHSAIDELILRNAGSASIADEIWEAEAQSVCP